MKKILKYALLGLAAVLLVVAGLIAFILATFDPNQYKPQIIQAVQDKQQRTLKLDGDIRLTLFPGIGAAVERMSLSEHNSEQEFAAIGSARFSLAVMPLLTKKVVISEIALNGVKVNVIKHRDGSTNLDDLIGKNEKVAKDAEPAGDQSAAPVAFDIAGVKVENVEMNYTDEGSAARYAVRNLNLKTGRIANGVPTSINLNAVVQASKPQLDIAAALQVTATLDIEKNLYQMEDMDLSVKGGVLDISDLQLNVSGNARASVAANEYFANKLSVTVQGKKGGDVFDASVKLPSFAYAGEKLAVGKLDASARLDGAIGKLGAAIRLQDVQGDEQTFKSAGLELDAEFKQPEQAFKLKLATPVAGSIKAKQLNLSNLLIALNASGEKIPNKSISSELKGSLHVDGERGSMQLNLAGGLLQSQLKSKLALKNFSAPAIRFDVELDQFDADPYMPKKAKAEVAKEPAAAEQPFDLSALQELNLNGSVRIGSLKVANIRASKLRVDVKAQNGLLNIKPLSASLYEGGTTGSIEVDVNPDLPTFSVKQTLSGVQIGPLVKDAADFDIAEGKANLNVQLTTQGNTVTAIKQGLNGTVALNMDGGALKGINLGKLVHGVQNLGQGVETLKPAAGDKTEFNELKANFKLANGVARNDDLLIKSQSLRVTGAGQIDIGNSSMDYGIKTTVAEAVDAKSGSMTIPVQLVGPFADLKIKVDYGAVVRDVAKQKLEQKKQQLQDELKNKMQDKLKGLFK